MPHTPSKTYYHIGLSSPFPLSGYRSYISNLSLMSPELETDCRQILYHWCHQWESKKMLVTQLCLILCDPMDSSPPGSSVHGILQARILEWVASLFTGDLPNSGTKSGSPALQADSLPSEPPSKPSATWEAQS